MNASIVQLRSRSILIYSGLFWSDLDQMMLRLNSLPGVRWDESELFCNPYLMSKQYYRSHPQKQCMFRNCSLLSCPSLVAQWLEHLHGKWKVLGSIPGLGKHFSPEYGCSLHSELPLKSLWMIGEELTTKHGMLGTNVLIDASMTGSALKITSFGWKTSKP